MKIRGALALVTGASSGIGAASAKALAGAGARVVLLARTAAALEGVAAEIARMGGTAHVVPVDLTDPDATARAAERVIAEAGVPDLVVNNAGAGQWRSVVETTPQEAREMMAAPYFAAFGVTRAFLPGMLARGTGHLVNVTSPAAYLAIPAAAAYTVARWAMRGFTEALRADLYGTRIRVSLFMPGKVSSAYWQHNPGSEERIPGLGNLIPTLTPDQAAAALVRGIERDRRLIVQPFLLRAFLELHWLCPRLVEWMAWRTGYRRGER